MPAPVADTIIAGAFNPIQGNVSDIPSHQEINEKISFTANDAEFGKDDAVVGDDEIKTASPPSGDGDEHDKDDNSENVIIITGADAAQHLLSLRDDREPALTFRSIFLATVLSGFQAVMNQIYQVS
jgi:hypothetical protein